MEAVVKLLSERTGVPEETVELVLKAVIVYLKERLPEPVAQQVEALLTGEAAEGVDVDDLLKGLGGLLGR